MLVYNIPDQLRGDTWNGITSISITRDGAPINLTNASIRMQVREDVDSPVVLDLSTSNNCITITNASNGTFSVSPILVAIPFGTYIYDIQVTFPNGQVKTYIKGNWNITPDVTE